MPVLDKENKMLLELHVTDLDITSGSAPITWCLDKELLEKVKSYQDPHLVISVLPENSRFSYKENRYVVPLKDMMAYVSFRSPGKNKIYAYLTETKPDSIMDKYERSFSTTVISNGEYAEFILGKTTIEQVPETYVDEDGDTQVGCWVDKEIVVPEKPHAIPLEVDVPAEYFAKEPAQWEKTWVLWLLKDKGIDQCAFRKRRILAYTPFLQPLVLFCNLFIRLLFTSVSFLLGLRGLSLKYLFHPLTYSLIDMHSDSHNHGIFDGGTVFVRPEPEKFKHGPNTFLEIVEYVVVRFWSLPFMPAIFIPLALVIYYHKFLILLVGSSILFGIILLVILGMAGAFGALFAWVVDAFIKVTNLGGDNEIEDLICTGDPTRKPKKRSIKLRYLALKSQVCKPFAG